MPSSVPVHSAYSLHDGTLQIMTKTQELWAKARRLLSDSAHFDEERERVLADYPELNSYGIGQTYRVRQKRRPDSEVRESVTEFYPPNVKHSRDELRAGGKCENGIRNTLEYLVEGRISLSYRLRGCGWARSFNGAAPARQSSYALKRQAESYLRELDTRECQTDSGSDRYVSNGAFICGALMAGARIWHYRNSPNPDLRLGAPWAVAGMPPEDFDDLRDQGYARFWRWAVQQDRDEPHFEDFIRGSVELLYAGADLRRLRDELLNLSTETREVYRELIGDFWHEFGPTTPGLVLSMRTGSMEGQYKVPDDFDTMGQEEIERMFYGEE